MLFGSFEFILVFLPLVLGGYALLGAANMHKQAMWFLTLASLVFYGWWDWDYLGLLAGSILANFLFGRILASHRSNGVLAAGIAFNLGLLAYFKYTNFLLDTVSTLSGNSFLAQDIILPLGISFFTFQQIAYLVDVKRGIAFEPDIGRYSLFVTFFPQLIAGPIVHHKELLPQYENKSVFQLRADNLSVGLSIFVVGLLKKIAFADPMGAYADRVFQWVDAGQELTLLSALFGTVAFGLQIYFDFSGYSDMAIGLARMFGIKLPLNFLSPYKAGNIISFWRRWHITLSKFLTDYLYIPLGGNRKGLPRRYTNLMIVMLLGGLWHGAAWTFVIWGGLHGFYLAVNHGWINICDRVERLQLLRTSLAWRVFAHSLTLGSVMFAWILFRSTSWESASLVIEGLFANGLYMPESYQVRLGFIAPALKVIGVQFSAATDAQVYPTLTEALSIGGLLCLVLIAPNSASIFGSHVPINHPLMTTCHRFLTWHPTAFSGLITSIGFLIGLGLLFSQQSNAFIYFQF